MARHLDLYEEEAIVSLLAGGATQGEIGAELGLAQTTVATVATRYAADLPASRGRGRPRGGALAEAVRVALAATPDRPAKEIASNLGCTADYVRKIAALRASDGE
jgi:DNA-binding CsgD family transcriptional regulator